MVDPENVDYLDLARRGDTEVMEIFLKAGLDPDFANERGHTLIMIAAYNDQPEMVDLLLAHGADPAVTDNQGQTAADLAEGHGHEKLAERLREATETASKS